MTDRAAVQAFAADLDRCDVLVNNAGGAFGADTVADSDPADWQAMYDVNVLGTLHVTQALLPRLIASGAGTIVIMGSTAGLISYEGGGGYVAAKHAEHAIAETLRLELYDQPVRIIEIAPGMVRTDEFAVNRYRGDAGRAAAVYAGVAEPLDRRRRGRHVAWAVTRPPHTSNVDLLVAPPARAQAAQHKVSAGRTPDSARAARSRRSGRGPPGRRRSGRRRRARWSPRRSTSPAALAAATPAGRVLEHHASRGRHAQRSGSGPVPCGPACPP